MIPTNSISVFLENNDLEFRSLVSSLCESLNFPGSAEDVIQDLYVKFLTSEIIESFDSNFRNKDTKMTTYLFPIIKNYIVSKIKSNECRYFRQNLRNYEPSDDVDEVELALCHNPIAIDYVDLLLYNESTDSPTGLRSDFRAFKRLLVRTRKNKRYLKKRRSNSDFLNELKIELTKLKKKEVDLDDPEYREISERIKRVQIDTGCTLIDVFILLYRGYSGKQIAKVYGVSDMSVTNVKYKLAKALFDYGIQPEELINKKGKSNDRNKMPRMPRQRRNGAFVRRKNVSFIKVL